MALQSSELVGNSLGRFAELALGCVRREYPNKISHSLNSDADVAAPRVLTPAFYGCYDWHSAVHGHWLLVRLLRLFPSAEFAAPAWDALRANLTAEKLLREAEYVSAPGRAAFERPYGLAWLLQLVAEVRAWEVADARQLQRNLAPLERVAVERLSAWLPKLLHPLRVGEHAQTAFAMGLMLDYARGAGDAAFADLVAARARDFFLNDVNGPLAYEPSGEDFLSPCLGEADVMRRVLAPAEFADWLRGFLPQISGAEWLRPVVSPDRGDPKFSHLDGLNLSRAWMLDGIASALPVEDERVPGIRAVAEEHRRVGLEAVTGEHDEGGHWLGTFAVYLVTRRGIGG